MESFSKAKQITGFVSWLVLSYAASAIGALGSIQAQSFYGQLNQPAWAPPAWLFGPVWTILFTLHGHCCLAGLAPGWVCLAKTFIVAVSCATDYQCLVELDLFRLAAWRDGICRNHIALAADRGDRGFVLAGKAGCRRTDGSLPALGQLCCCAQFCPVADESADSWLNKDRPRNIKPG